jgi:NADH pyrophosphatase NudC (nudix superfamily)
MKYCHECGAPLRAVTIEGIERLACSSDSCNYVFWNNPTPVVCAIVEHEGNIVLTHKSGWPQTMFGVVAGFLEKDETPEEAILREVREEVGLVGEAPEFIGCYSFFERNQIILGFHVKAHGEIEIGEELDQIKLVSPEELKPWPVGTGHAVKDWLEQRKKGDVEGR